MIYRFAGFELDPERRSLRSTENAEPVVLTAKPFDTLLYLIEHRGRLVEKQTLLEAVWPNVIVDEANLPKTISTLRRVLGDHSPLHEYIATIAGRGYQFVASVEIVGPELVRDAVALPTSIESSRHASLEPLTADRLAAARAAPVRSRAGIAWWTAGLALVATLGAVAIALTRRAPVAPAGPSQFAISPPEKATLGSARRAAVALSPDGRQLVFAATDADDVSRLWVRPLSSSIARPLNGTEDGVWPFWSPDSKSVGFFARGKLRRVDLAGGPQRILADAAFPFGGTWNRDGVIVFSPSLGSPLLRMPAAGGTPTPVTAPPGTLIHTVPFFLPDGRHFLFAAVRSPSQGDIMIASLDSTEVTKILTGVVGFGAAYAAPGYLLFLREGTLMAQAFDDARLATRGEPRPVVENVSGGLSFAASQDGTLVFQSGAAAQKQLVWVGRDGQRSGAVAPPGAYSNVALSRDETRLAFDLYGPSGHDVWLMDLQRGVTSRFTFQSPNNKVPLWSPDGRYVAFATFRNGALDIYRRPSNLSGPEESLLELGAAQDMIPSDWSADGRFLTYYRTGPNTQHDVWVLRIADDGNGSGNEKPFALLHEAYNESQPQFSPDGKWIAYVSDESGTAQIYVQSFPVLTAKWQISTDGATEPRWSRDGKELFYLTLNRTMTAAAVTTGDNFEVHATRALFDTTQQPSDNRQTYSVSADGQRFLLSVPVEAAALPLTVVLNWPALLE
jgi:Tol biopolymer transport system component/DNA-binding winged helix-turn-helix (wHTH) protein